MPIKLWPLLIGLTSAWLAQFLKVFYYKLRTKKWNWKVSLTTGGMPSSHTTAFSAVATSIFILEGYSTGFTISASILLLVMHDATNIRWFGGVSSQKITDLTEQLQNNQLIKINKILKQKSKDVLGHKASEVFAGLILGIVLGIVFMNFVI